MTLQQVLNMPKVLDGEYWFRPGSWRGCGVAFVVENEIVNIVPNDHGGDPFMTPKIADLTATDWVVVTPEMVIDEN